MDQLYDVSYEAIRVLYLLGIPLLVAGLAAGIVSFLLQSFFLFHDAGVSYVARALAVLGVITLFSGTAFMSLQSLFERAFQP